MNWEVRTMASPFNATIIKRNLTRFWPFLVIHFILLFLFLSAGGFRESGSYILERLRICGASMLPVMAAFAALCTFGYLHNARAAVFAHSLPVRRGTQFWSNYLSGVLMLSIPAALVLLLDIALHPGMTGRDIMDFMFRIAVLILLYYSTAVFCAMLTGNPFVGVFLYTLINFLWVMLVAISQSVLELLMYGFSGWDSPSLIFSPPVWVGFGHEDGTAVRFGYLIFAALITTAALLLYRRRRIESAGETVSGAVMRKIFKYGIALLLSLGMSFLLIYIFRVNMESRGVIISYLVFFTVLFGAIGYFGTEMLMKRTFRVFRAYKGYICFIAVILAGIGIVSYDPLGFQTSVPDPSKVEAVFFSYNEYPASIEMNGKERDYLFARANLNLSQQYIDRISESGGVLLTDEVKESIEKRSPGFFRSPESIALATEAHRRIVEERNRVDRQNSQTFDVIYRMKDGSFFRRSLPVGFSESGGANPDSAASAVLRLYNSSEAMEKRLEFLKLPQDELLLAAVTPVPASRDADTASESAIVFPKEADGLAKLKGQELDGLMEALKKDAAAGTLMKSKTINQWGYARDTVMIDLVYSYSVLPSWFNVNEYYSGDETLRGYVATISVSEEDVNTFGFLADYARRAEQEQ